MRSIGPSISPRPAAFMGIFTRSISKVGKIYDELTIACWIVSWFVASTRHIISSDILILNAVITGSPDCELDSSINCLLSKIALGMYSQYSHLDSWNNEFLDIDMIASYSFTTINKEWFYFFTLNRGDVVYEKGHACLWSTWHCRNLKPMGFDNSELPYA